jgi:hypothetical protein
MPEFDHYPEIYKFSTMQYQFQNQNDWDQVLVAQLYVLNLTKITDIMNIKYLRTVALPPIFNVVGICRQVSILIFD